MNKDNEPAAPKSVEEKLAEAAITQVPSKRPVPTPPSPAKGDDDIMSKQEKAA